MLPPYQCDRTVTNADWHWNLRERHILAHQASCAASNSRLAPEIGAAIKPLTEMSEISWTRGRRQRRIGPCLSHYRTDTYGLQPWRFGSWKRRQAAQRLRDMISKVSSSGRRRTAVMILGKSLPMCCRRSSFRSVARCPVRMGSLLRRERGFYAIEEQPEDHRCDGGPRR
jgi:hypothetical protein